MSYNKIQNPITGRSVKVASTLGKKILKNYIIQLRQSDFLYNSNGGSGTSSEEINPNKHTFNIPRGTKKIDKNSGKEWGIDITIFKKITIPSSVEVIGDGAFRDCRKLVDVIIPPSVILIGKGAFDGCYRLIKVTIPDKVRSIAGNAFRSCISLIEITISDEVSLIGKGTF